MADQRLRKVELHRVDRRSAACWCGSRPTSCCGCRWSSAATRPSSSSSDADLEAAVDGAMLAKMRNMGEACTAANRFLVHESVAASSPSGSAERMGALRVGRGTEDGVDVGPLIDADARRQGRPSWSPTPSTTGPRCSPAATAPERPGLLLRADRAARRAARRRGHPRGDLRPGRADHDVLAPTRRRSGWPTTPSTAWSPTSTPEDLAARDPGRASGWRPAWSASTPGSCPTPRRRSAA